MSGAAARQAPLTGRQLGACAFFVFAPIGIQMPFFPLWLANSGFTPTLIALLLGVAPIVRFAANLTIPPQADRSGDAPGVLLACAALTAVAQGLSGLPFGIAWIFTLSLVATAGQGPMVPLLDSIVLREVQRRAAAREPNLDYGRVRGIGSVSVLILMLMGGAAASVAPTSAIIWLIAGASAIAAIAIAVLLPRVKATRRRGSAVAPKAPLANRSLIALVIAASSAIQASHGMIYAFGSIGWRRAGYSDGGIGLLWGSGVATEVALFVFATKLARGRSLSYPLLVTGSFIAVVRWLVMASDPGPVVLLLAQLLHAGSFAATYLGAVVAISALSGEARRAQVQGWVSAANALTLAAVTILSGPLWSAFGMRAYLFVAALAMVGLGCAVAAALRSDRAQPQSEDSGGQTTEPS